MSKMSQLSAEMDNKNIPEADRNSLINRVSEGMHAAEKRIDSAASSAPARSQTPSPMKQQGLTLVIGRTAEGHDIVRLANAIRDFAAKTHNVVLFDGKTYVKVGVYQYLAALLGIVPKFTFADVSTSTEVWCTCELYKEYTPVTSATMYAEKTEEFLKDKPAYAVIGTAQTRAFSRAMKNCYGYIIELAGFQSVGVEEIEINKANRRKEQ